MNSDSRDRRVRHCYSQAADRRHTVVEGLNLPASKRVCRTACPSFQSSPGLYIRRPHEPHSFAKRNRRTARPACRRGSNTGVKPVGRTVFNRVLSNSMRGALRVAAEFGTTVFPLIVSNPLIGCSLSEQKPLSQKYNRLSRTDRSWEVCVRVLRLGKDDGSDLIVHVAAWKRLLKMVC